MIRNFILLCVVIVLAPIVAIGAKEEPPTGLIAASAGDSVALVDPVTGTMRLIPSGPVAWLFPAPGGTLFAPDLVHGTTSVIDLRSQSAREPIDGVTMPHFGTLGDRYVVVAHQLLVMSYPERALMNRFEIAFQHPWQVAVVANNSVLLVLERDPVGEGPSALVAVNLGDGGLVYRRPLEGDIPHFALSPLLGVIALADATYSQVVLADPATLTPLATFEVAGTPVDLAFVSGGSILIVASEEPDGGGRLDLWKIKAEKKHGLVQKKQWEVSLDGRPIRMAVSPDERHVVVGLADGHLQIVDVEAKATVQAADLPAAPRDIVWCDPSTPGPLLPDWTDDDPPTLDLGG